MVPTVLDFVGDAICLSGLTGTKLKCDVIGEYYQFWWKITSGGPSRDHRFQTAIVELNAATGEVHIKETQETVLGSAGHALELKHNISHTENLKVVLIEKDPDCYTRLKRVIRRKWTSIQIDGAEGPVDQNSSNIYLLNTALDEALKTIETLDLGNALYFFDPLRSVEYGNLEKVANQRISAFYQTRTEFFIFVFTSDWFLGRDELAPLPNNPQENSWTAEQIKTVLEADLFFGDKLWRERILTSAPIENRMEVLIELYKKRLRKWFRYVLPLPFRPKEAQIFHLILCSNYEAGVRATRNFYSEKTGNPRYKPDNRAAFNRFKILHPEVFLDLRRKKRPPEWKTLWAIVKHEDGICDCMCSDLMRIEADFRNRERILEWLEEHGCLIQVDLENAWDSSIAQYKLDWESMAEKLGVSAPLPLIPLSPRDIK